MGAAAGLGLVTGRDKAKLAAQATEALGSLRGMAAKVGQIASTVEGMLPEALESTFSSALARLRDQTERSPYEEIERVVEAELGAPLAELFADFSREPMASASVGQVHRATLRDGRAVAVKVQHPGIERAMESDLRNAQLVERMATSLVPAGFQVDRTFQEVAERFREELDYRLEAANQRRFQALHAAVPEVRIPAVMSDFCSRRVLTTELVEGRRLEEMLASCGESERAGYAATLWSFVFRSLLVGGEFNADPHPGNYLFGPMPTIAFLDFGCVQRLSAPRLNAARALHRAAVAGLSAQFEDAVRELLSTRGGAYERFALGFTRRAFAPLFESPFHMSADYLRGLVNYSVEHKLELLKDRRHATAFPAELALLNRLQFGFYSLLSKLDVTVDYAALQRGILAELEGAR